MKSFFIQEAFTVAKESTCLKRHVGAVIVIDNSIVSRGCNGGPLQYLHCKNGDSQEKCHWKAKAYEYTRENNISFNSEQFNTVKRELRSLCLSICAERQAIYKTNRVNELMGAEMYCTTYPCPTCAKLIRLSGIRKVFFVHDFDINLPSCRETYRIFKEAGIEQEEMELNSADMLIGNRTNYEYREKESECIR